jgi:hypothetical protein
MKKLACMICVAFLMFLLNVETKIYAQKFQTKSDTKGTIKTDSLLKYAPKGHFVKDSIRIGEPLAYTLVATYPSEWQVVFPDTSYRFEPFQLVKKKPYFTVSKGNLSTDSVIYELALFSTKPIQKLKIPIFLIREKDTLKIYANTDSIFLKNTLKVALSDTISIQKDTKMLAVAPETDYWNTFLKFAGVFTFITLIGIFFGNWFVKQFNLLNLQRRQIIFDANFEQLLNRIRSRKRIKDIENSLILWKKYLEDLEKKPFSTYTSTEISTLLQIPQLAECLQKLDKVIYGQVLSESINDDLAFLQILAKQRSTFQKQQIR